MKPNHLPAHVALLLSGTLLLTHTPSAAEQPADEVIVLGTPAEVVFDADAWHINGKHHADVIARSVREALSDASPIVATAGDRDRG